MAVEIAGTCLHWFQSPLPLGSLPHKTLARAISSLHATSRNFHDRVNSQHTGRRSHFLGVARLHHSPHQRGRARGGRIMVSSTISLDGFFGDGEDDEDEFVKRYNELALQFKIEADSRGIRDIETINICEEDTPSPSYSSSEELPSIAPTSEPIPTLPNSINPDITRILAEPWPGSDRFTLEKVESRANSIDLPLSLRILKRKKKRWESAELTNSDCSSVNKAFSFMVFIVRELQSHAICLREALFSPDNFQIKGILARVHEELHASFVWLFYRVFSATPNLMVCLMLLLANFTVFSITEHQAIAAPQPPIQSVSTSLEESQKPNQRFNSSDVKTFSVGKSIVVGGSGNGGGKAPFLAGAADDGHSHRSSSSFVHGTSISHEAMSTASIRKEEATVWKGIVEEARMMQAAERHEALMDPETLRRFVSPVTAVAELDDISAYYATEVSYQLAIAEDPDDALLLSNFAQFLFTVFRDNDRAEEYFKRAARAEPADAEALSRYANFLWVARSDLSAAEETFLEAIAADPGNSYYTANYAHFLWSTGGEDTCYPLAGCDS